MMMPTMTSSFSSSSSSSPSATVRVEKATSEFLIGPDWTLNMDICDTINSNQLLGKDVVKAVKKRLQHKNPKVQLLALTLLEAMVKNCGDYVHFQIAEKNILGEMIKIVKKKADMHVRDKILTLLDSWQEAFGGPGGKYPQYYWAYDELRRYGVQFPERSYDTAPIFTPPVTHPTPRQPQPGYGMPSNSSIRLDEAMATETENLSLSSLNAMRDVVDLLGDMLQAVNPSDRSAIEDEVIVDLVERCRANQKNLAQTLATTGDEELLAQGLELNDILQSLLAKHDAIASGSPLPVATPHVRAQSSEKHDMSPKSDEARKSNGTPDPSPSAPAFAHNKGREDEDEDEEDDFAQLARRHTKVRPSGPQSALVDIGEGVHSINSQNGTTPGMSPTPVMSNALVLSDPPAPVRTRKEQDIVELLSLTLSTGTSSPRTPQTPGPSTLNMDHVPVSSSGVGNPYNSPAYVGNQPQMFNSYIAPWAQPQPQPHHHFQPQVQPQHQFHPQAPSEAQTPHQYQPQAQQQHQFQQQSQHHFQPQAQQQQQVQPQSQHHFRPQAQQQQFHHQPQPEAQPQHQFQPEGRAQTHYQPQPQQQNQTQPPTYQLQQSTVQLQPQAQQQYLQQASNYPPPPWAQTPGYFSNTGAAYRPYTHSTPQTTGTASIPPQQHLQHVNSIPVKGSSSSVNGEAPVTSSPKISNSSTGHKPFIPSYRLFEDLNVLGNTDGGPKAPSNSSPSLSEARSQNMLGERK